MLARKEGWQLASYLNGPKPLDRQKRFYGVEVFKLNKL